MMWESRFAWPMAGIVLLLAAGVSIFVIRQDGSGITADGIEKATLPHGREAGNQNGPPVSGARGKTKRSEVELSEVSRRLQKLREGEDITAVHEELKQLAEARRLAEAEPVLRGWCRTGELVLVLWVLEFSEKSDARLHLDLAAEALSNRAGVVRECASMELIMKTGTRFESSAEAFSWLDQNRK